MSPYSPLERIGSWITIQENTATVIMPDMHLETFEKKKSSGLTAGAETNQSV